MAIFENQIRFMSEQLMTEAIHLLRRLIETTKTGRWIYIFINLEKAYDRELTDIL